MLQFNHEHAVFSSVTFSQVVAGEGHLGQLHATGEMVGSIGNGGGKRSRWVSLILEHEGFLAFFAPSVAKACASAPGTPSPSCQLGLS